MGSEGFGTTCHSFISMKSIHFLLLLSIVTLGCTSWPETEADETPAGLSAAMVTDQGESWYTRSNGENVIVWGKHAEGWTKHELWGMEQTEEGWSEAAVLPFSGTYNDRGARFYPGLDAMIFSSDRPLPGETEAGDFNLWIGMHDGVGWTEPEPLMSLNSDANDFHGSVAGDASVFFASDREGSNGRSDLYRAELGIEGYDVTHLSGRINSEYSEADVWVDPAMRYLIFSRTDDPAGFGGDDLWISFKDGEDWGEPVNLGPAVNSAEYEYGAWVSRDGLTLYFTTHADGDADIRTVQLADLGIQGPEGWLETGMQ